MKTKTFCCSGSEKGRLECFYSFLEFWLEMFLSVRVNHLMYVASEFIEGLQDYLKRLLAMPVISVVLWACRVCRDVHFEYRIASVTRPNGQSSNTYVTVADQPIAERTPWKETLFLRMSVRFYKIGLLIKVVEYASFQQNYIVYVFHFHAIWEILGPDFNQNGRSCRKLLMCYHCSSCYCFRDSDIVSVVCSIVPLKVTRHSCETLRDLHDPFQH